MNPDTKQLKTLEDLQSFLSKTELHQSLPIFEVLQAINKNLEAIANREPQEIPPRPEVQKVVIEGLEGMTLEGKPGKDYVLTEADKLEIASKVEVPIVEKVIEKTEIIREIPTVTEVHHTTNEVKEVAVTETGGQIVAKINETEEFIARERVEGLDGEIARLDKRIDAKSSTPRGGGKKITYIKRYNLTSQVNGVAKTFTLPNDTIEVIGVWGTQFPVNFNPGTDWTFAGRTLTLTSEVSAPATGQTLWCMIETLFFG